MENLDLLMICLAHIHMHEFLRSSPMDDQLVVSLTATSYDFTTYDEKRLSSQGGNSGSTKFLHVLSKSTCSISSSELSAIGNTLKIFLALSIEDFRFA